MELRPTILIDTREQHPWCFANLATERVTLDTGDYSIRGLEHLVAVERKSLDDLLGCIGRERDRFKRELARMRGYRFRSLVIEASLAAIEAGQWRSQLKPSHVLGALAAWQAQYDLPIVLAGAHAAAGRWGERYLYQAARTIAIECEVISAMCSATSGGGVEPDPFGDDDRCESRRESLMAT